MPKPKNTIDKRDLPSTHSAHPLSSPSFTIGKNGYIDPDDAPGTFFAAKGEVVAWAISYTDKKPITVTLMDFLGKKAIFERRGSDPIDDYFEWIPQNTHSLPLGGTNPSSGYLYARITKKAKHVFGDPLSYTIRVKADDGTFDIFYDPDGEIKP